MRSIAAWIALSSWAATAGAFTTHFTLEVSSDPALQGWARDLTVWPGATVYVQVRASVDDNGSIFAGLASATYQPTLSGWAAGDEQLPFTFPGLDGSGAPTTETEYAGRHVSASPPTNTGRLFPFGASGQGTTSASGLLTSFVEGDTLRFAGSRNTTPTTNLSWGVASTQLTPTLGGTNFDTRLDVVLFRYAVRLGQGGRDLVASVPMEFVVVGRINWYFGVVDPPGPPTLTPTLEAMIHVVPCPGAVAGVLSLSAGVARRRRGCSP
jgi:hypothetical protein